MLSDNYPVDGTAAGGIGTYTRILATELVDLGHEAHVFAFANSQRNSDNGIHLHLLKPWSKRREITWRALIGFTRRHLKAEDLNAYQLGDAVRREARRSGAFDVVESPEFAGLGRFLVDDRRTARRLAVRLHGPATLSDARGTGLWRPLGYDPESALERSADVVTAPTDAAVRRCEAAWGRPAHAAIVPNPVQTQGAPSYPRQGADVLFVGRLERQKGIDLLADTLATTASKPILRLLGPDMPWNPSTTASEMLRSRGVNVDSPGVVAHHRVIRELDHAKTAVFPSRGESFGLGLAEAMMSGAPSIASDIPAFRELDGGSGAVQLVPFDPDAWAGALDEYLSDRESAEARGRMGHERALDWEPRRVARTMLETWMSSMRT